jgi:hypothetical protein
MDRLVTSPEQFAEYMGLEEMGRELGIHPMSVRRLIKQGRLKDTHYFAGKYFIHQDDLRAFKEGYDPRPGRKTRRRLL